jgi:MFS transporter, DHA2 family, multidrug resistance protein
MVVLFNAGSYIALMPHVAGDLGGVLPSLGTWGQTDFMIGLALAFPIARWLSGRFGDYRVFAAAFALYAVASWLCAISETMLLFLPSRIMLGFAGGVTLPIGQSLLLREYPDHRKSLGLGVWGLFTLMPFTIGFPIGGWIGDETSWRYLFCLNVPFALAIAGCVGSLLYGRGFRRRFTRFDFVGFMLLALVLGGVQTLFNQGNDFDWLDSPFLRGVAISAAIALPCLVIWELGERHPAIEVRLFAHRNFAVGLTCLTLGFLFIQGLLSLLIVQLQLILGYSSFLAGLEFLAMILLAAPVIAVMHELVKGVDARLLACINLLGCAFTVHWIGLLDGPEAFDQLFWPMLLLGFFVGSFFTPLTALTLHGLPPELMLRGAEEAAALRIAAGAYGITLQGVMLFRRTPFHQLDLADHLGGRRFASFDALEQLGATLQNAGLDAGLAKLKLAALLKQQAGVLALNDAFLLASQVFIGLAALVWLAHPTHRPRHPQPAEELREVRAEELMDEP